MEGLVPGDKEKDVSPSTRSFFHMPGLSTAASKGVGRVLRTILNGCTFVDVDLICDVPTTNFFVLRILQTPSILAFLYKFLD